MNELMLKCDFRGNTCNATIYDSCCIRTAGEIRIVKHFFVQHMFGGIPYLTFEHVSLVPYERKLIDLSILNEQQVSD